MILREDYKEETYLHIINTSDPRLTDTMDSGFCYDVYQPALTGLHRTTEQMSMSIWDEINAQQGDEHFWPKDRDIDATAHAIRQGMRAGYVWATMELYNA